MSCSLEFTEEGRRLSRVACRRFAWCRHPLAPPTVGINCQPIPPPAANDLPPVTKHIAKRICSSGFLTILLLQSSFFLSVHAGVRTWPIHVHLEHRNLRYSLATRGCCKMVRTFDITQLPPELLNIIVDLLDSPSYVEEHLEDDPAETFDMKGKQIASDARMHLKNASSVSRQWNRIFRPMIFRHIFVRLRLLSLTYLPANTDDPCAGVINFVRVNQGSSCISNS